MSEISSLPIVCSSVSVYTAFALDTIIKIFLVTHGSAETYLLVDHFKLQHVFSCDGYKLFYFYRETLLKHSKQINTHLYTYNTSLMAQEHAIICSFV